MSEYIEREAAIEAMYKDAEAHPEHTFWVTQIEALRNIPAADVRPVQRGKWIGYPECLKYANAYSDDHIVCSACEECYSILDNDCERFNFCPNCGADMRPTSMSGANGEES